MMKRLNLIIILLTGFLMITPLFSQNKSNKTKRSNEIINWLLEDDSPKNGWDFSMTWKKDKDKIGRTMLNKNVEVSTKQFYEGKTSLKLAIKHYPLGSTGCYISTCLDNSGKPPTSSYEANQGKDLSKVDTLEFWVKAEGKALIKNIKIELIDTKNLTTDGINLVDYLELSKQWKKVEIPLDEFSWISGVDIKSIKAITFFVDKNDPEGKYYLFIDNIRFIQKEIEWKKRYKLVFEAMEIKHKAWDYSGMWEGNGTTIEKSEWYGNIPISIEEKYQGFSSVKFHVRQRQGGWAGMWFSGNAKGNGLPPTNWDDYDTPKDISVYNAIRLFVKGKGRHPGGKIELGDVDKNSSQKVNITEFVSITNSWREVIIPFSEIKWQKFNKKRFKEFKFMIDDDHPAGEFFLYFDNLEFIKLP